MRTISIELLALIMIASNAIGSSGEKTKVSIQDLPSMVREANEKVLSAEASLKASSERTWTWARTFAPKFTIEGGAEEFSSDAVKADRKSFWRLETSVNVFRGGRDFLEYEAKQADFQARKSDFASTYQDQLKEARISYWELLATEILLKNARAALEENEQNIRSARRRVGAGVATNSDVLQFELYRTSLTQEIKEAELRQQVMRNRLAASLAIKNPDQLEISGDFPAPEAKLTLPTVPIEEQLAIKSMSERRKIESLRQDQARRWWQPKVDLYSSYGIPSLSQDYDAAAYRWKDLSVGVRVQIDLGDGAIAQPEARARAYEAAALEKEIAHSSRSIQSLERELHQSLNSLAGLIRDAEADIVKSKSLLKLTEGEYARGSKNGPDLLEAFKGYHDFLDRRTALLLEFHKIYSELLALTAGEAQ